MKILVTGGNGQLGNCLRIASLKSKNEFIFSDIAQESEESCQLLRKLGHDNIDTTTLLLDITNQEQIDKVVEQFGIDMIVNTAAWTNVDLAEDKQVECHQLNAVAPRYLATAMAKKNGFLIHISTDYVFDGTGHKPYAPSDETHPISTYGATKLGGELVIQDAECKNIIIRTAWLYSPFGKNFVKTMLRLTSEKDEVKVVSDQIGTPTNAMDLAKAIIHIIESGEYENNQGTYHFANLGICSWYDLASRVQLKAETRGKVIPCNSDEFPSKVKRPKYSALSVTKIVQAFKIQIPTWDVALDDCIKILVGK